MEDGNGYKLIAFQHVTNVPKNKPIYGTTIFADFKGDWLRVFNGNDCKEYRVINFRNALYFIQHLDK